MEWWQLARNPQLVFAYYSDPPPLAGVEVHSVRLHRDGPTLELIVELPRFPDLPSPRWPAGANAAQAELRFFDLRAVTLTSWGATNIGNLDLSADADGIRFQFSGPTVRVEGVAGFFDVVGIVGYLRGMT